MIMNDLSPILSISLSYTLDEYEAIIADVLQNQTETIYEKKYHDYIRRNSQIEQFIQSNLRLNKKFFNRVLKLPDLTIGLITEAWCLDACIILPLLRAVVASNERIRVEVFLRDSNEAVMNQYLSNGSKSIPVIFGRNANNQELFRWGPRSGKAILVLEPVKNEKYDLKYSVLSNFYLSDLTLDIQEEWIDLFVAAKQ